MTPAIKGIIVSKASVSRMNVITFTNNVIENIAQRLGASFALVAFGLFSASGNNVQAMASTSFIIMGFIAIALLFLPLIPHKIPGIHKSMNEPEQQEKVKIPAVPAAMKQEEIG